MTGTGMGCSCCVAPSCARAERWLPGRIRFEPRTTPRAALLTNFSSRSRVKPPASTRLGAPFSKSTHVGSAATCLPCFESHLRKLSVSSGFALTTLTSPVAWSSRSSGSTSLHGPHQSVKKSTITGLPSADSEMTAS